MDNKNYNLSLPCWGPYNKEYLGAAHIADKDMGLRFDLNLFPGYYRRSVISVRYLADSGTKMMALQQTFQGLYIVTSLNGRTKYISKRILSLTIM